jgi:hypothetical protein
MISITINAQSIKRDSIYKSDNHKITSVTNDLGQVTKTQMVGTNTITIIYNDQLVPIRYRDKWNNFTEEEKSMILTSEQFIEESFSNPLEAVTPIKSKVENSSTDLNLTTEIRVIRLRPLKD